MKEMQIRTETRETNEKMLFYAIELKSYLYVLVQPPSQSQQNKYCMGWVGGLSEERVMSGIFTTLNPKQLRGLADSCLRFRYYGPTHRPSPTLHFFLPPAQPPS